MFCVWRPLARFTQLEGDPGTLIPKTWLTTERWRLPFLLPIEGGRRWPIRDMGDSVQWVRGPDAQASELSTRRVPLVSGQPDGDSGRVPCPRSRQPSTPHKALRGSLCPGHSGGRRARHSPGAAHCCRRSALGLARALGPLTSEVFGHSHGTAMLTEKDLEQLIT